MQILAICLIFSKIKFYSLLFKELSWGVPNFSLFLSKRAKVAPIYPALGV
jgi:hypothetical protein